LKNDILKYIKRKNHKYDLIGSAIIGWKVLHHQILLYRKKYPNWHFVRHEDLSVNPINYFQILYEKLNLDFTRKVSSAILKSTSGNGLEGNQRNAALNVAKWKKILSKKEIERIKKQTGDYYPLFYSENEW